MANMVKMTFTVDEGTVELLRGVAARLKKPQSVVFREAIRDYAERAGRLTDEERDRMLSALDRMVARKPPRRLADVDAELQVIRAARKTGGRRSRVE
jgi:hypothetical protein